MSQSSTSGRSLRAAATPSGPETARGTSWPASSAMSRSVWSARQVGISPFQNAPVGPLPAGIGELGGIAQQVSEHLGEPAAVAVIPDGLWGKLHEQREPGGLEDRALVLTDLADDPGQV